MAAELYVLHTGYTIVKGHLSWIIWPHFLRVLLEHALVHPSSRPTCPHLHCFFQLAWNLLHSAAGTSRDTKATCCASSPRGRFRRKRFKRSNQSMDRLQGIVMQTTLIHYFAGDMDRLFLGVMIETWVPLDLMMELHINWQKVTSITSLHNGAARSKESSSNIFVYKCAKSCAAYSFLIAWQLKQG